MSTVGTESSGSSLGAQDDRPLNDQEYQLLQRLLSDPFSFPVQFKTWLISYLETSDLSLPISAIEGLSALLGISGAGGGTLGIFPAGIILPFGGDVAPVGSLLCNGAAYNISDEMRLYTAIGTRFGAPSPTTFNVPSMQDRIPIGRGTNPLTDTVGKNDGLPPGSRGLPHHHDVNIGVGVSGGTSGVGDHSHGYRRHTEAGLTVQQGTAGPAITTGQPGGFDDNSGAAGGHSHSVSASGTVSGSTTGGGSRDYPSFLVLNWIIVN